MKEPVGNLVVTDLQKYLEKSKIQSSANNQVLNDSINEFSRSPYEFNRIRPSVIDAYEGKIYKLFLIYRWNFT